MGNFQGALLSEINIYVKITYINTEIKIWLNSHMLFPLWTPSTNQRLARDPVVQDTYKVKTRIRVGGHAPMIYKPHI